MNELDLYPYKCLKCGLKTTGSYISTQTDGKLQHVTCGGEAIQVKCTEIKKIRYF